MVVLRQIFVQIDMHLRWKMLDLIKAGQDRNVYLGKFYLTKYFVEHTTSCEKFRAKNGFPNKQWFPCELNETTVI